MSDVESHLVSIDTVRTGVYILGGEPSKELVESGQFFTAQDFGQAGVEAGKSVNYGQGVMRDIALQMVSIEAKNHFIVNGKQGGWIVRGTPEYDLYYKIFYMMNNPDMIKEGSRNRLLLGTQLVYDTWRASEGALSPDDLPMFGKVGRRIISMLFQEEITARALVDEQPSQLL